MTYEARSRRKYKRIFDEAVRQLLNLQGKIEYQWKVVCTTDKSVAASWTGFNGGSKTQAAIAEVTINGNPYWAEACVRLDDGDFEWQLWLGLLGLWYMGEKISVSFWETDPSQLPHPINDYWSSRPPEGAPRRMFITEAGNVSPF